MKEKKCSLNNFSAGKSIASFILLFVVSACAFSQSQSVRLTMLGNIVAGTDQQAPLLFRLDAMTVSGTYAYGLSAIDASLQIVDISTPTSPVAKGTLLNTQGGAKLGNPTSISVSGNYAYITSQADNALEIVDISNPAVPKHISNVSIDMGAGLSGAYANVIASGNYAFVTVTFSNSFIVVDISNPFAPFVVGKLGSGNSIFSNPWAFAIAGNYAYILNNESNSLQIVDISNPTAPVAAGVISDGINGALLKEPTSVALQGHYAYITSEISNALEIVDISNPASPAHAGSLTWGTGGAMLDSPLGLFITGGYAYITGANGYLEILSLANPIAPAHVGTIVNSSSTGASLYYATSLYVSNKYAFVPSIEGVIDVVDVSVPSNPVQAGAIINGSGVGSLGDLRSLVSAGNFVYATATESLEIFNVATPSSPTRAASVTSTSVPGAQIGVPTSVAVSGNYAYVVGLNAKLEILDITNPNLPLHVSSLTNGQNGTILDFPSSMCISGKYAFVANKASLEVIDISNVTAPAHVINLSNGSGGMEIDFPSAIALSGNHLFITNTEGPAGGSLEIVDISNPTHPVHAGLFGGGILNIAGGVSVNGNYAYVSDFSQLHIIDISNPSNPAHVSGLTLTSNFYGSPGFVQAVDNFVFVSIKGDSSSGGARVVAVDVSKPASPQVAGSLWDKTGFGLLNNPVAVVSGTNLYIATELGFDVASYCLMPSKPVVTVTQPSCSVPNGSVTVAVENSTDQYSFNGGSSFQSSSDASSLPKGLYEVSIRNASGCISDTTSFAIYQAPPVPQKPIVIETQSSPLPIFSSNAVAGNQWFFDGVALPNATSPNLTATQSGLYSVQVYNGHCYSEMSDTLSAVVTEIIPSSKYCPSCIYPNPAINSVMIDLTSFTDRIIQVELFNSAGQLIESFSFSNSLVSLPIQNYPAGTYFIEIAQGRLIYSAKLVKIQQ